MPFVPVLVPLTLDVLVQAYAGLFTPPLGRNGLDGALQCLVVLGLSGGVALCCGGDRFSPTGVSGGGFPRCST